MATKPLPAPTLASSPAQTRCLFASSLDVKPHGEPAPSSVACAAARAGGGGGGEASSSDGGGKNPFAALVEATGALWRQAGGYGFGKHSVWEGGVGLFMVSGAALLALTLAWLRGFQLRSRFMKYQAVLEFGQACGICVGTPERIHGVMVRNVVRVDSSVRSFNAVVEFDALVAALPLISEEDQMKRIQELQYITIY